MSQSELTNFEAILKGLRDNKDWFFTKIIYPELAGGLFEYLHFYLRPGCDVAKFLIQAEQNGFKFDIYYHLGFLVPNVLQAEIRINGVLDCRTPVFDSLSELKTYLKAHENYEKWLNHLTD